MKLPAAPLLVGVMALLASPSARAEAPAPLQPYQMVRSLQLVQDRIAAGDHAALPMQRKLLEMIDARLREGGPEGLADLRNFRAMLVYAMSGGNPSTIDMMMADLDMDEESQRAGAGILNYLNGRTGNAQVALAPVDPMKVPAELGAFLALVKGSVTSGQDPLSALKFLDQARLLGPGTLVDEAALRRSISLAATVGDGERFLRASGQYVRTFLRSPYASQFADAFVSGVITLHASLDLAKLGDITAGMDPEQQQVIYLRIARRAAIDGLTELSAFASAKAVELPGTGTIAGEDPRALLYSSLASVTSASVEDLQARIARIDRDKLSAGDRKLYDAVSAVAGELVSPPPAVIDAAAKPEPVLVKAAPLPAEEHAAEPEKTEPPAPAAHTEAPVEPTHEEASQDVSESKVADPAEAAKPMDAADTMVAETRKKLDAIDQLLGEAK